MIKIKQKGDFSNLDKYFKKSVKITKVDNITIIAQRCIDRLKEVTPKDTGLTAESWEYSIINNKNNTILEISNTNVQKGVKIALILDIGHATSNGAWIQGKNYIEPVVRSAYNEILNNTWKELTKL